MTPRVPRKLVSYQLPVDDLLAAMEAQVYGGSIDDLGIALSRAYFRLKQREAVSWITADHICGAIGRHPSEVYGATWWLLMTQIDEDLHGPDPEIADADPD